MKVKFLKECRSIDQKTGEPQTVFNKGAILDLTEAGAKYFIEQGLAEAVAEDPAGPLAGVQVALEESAPVQEAVLDRPRRRT